MCFFQVITLHVCSIYCPLPCASESANPSEGLADPQGSAEQILDFADPREDSSYLEAVLKEPASEGSEIADTGKARTKSVEEMVVKQGATKRCRLCRLGGPIAPSYMRPNAGRGGGRVAGSSQPMSTVVHMEPK
jgi:hypothetical protein